MRVSFLSNVLGITIVIIALLPSMGKSYTFITCTQKEKRTILSLKKEPRLHILNNPLESQIIGPCRRAIKTALFQEELTFR